MIFKYIKYYLYYRINILNMTENSTEIKYQELIKKISKDKDIYKTNFNYELSKNINHPLTLNIQTKHFDLYGRQKATQ